MRQLRRDAMTATCRIVTPGGERYNEATGELEDAPETVHYDGPCSVTDGLGLIKETNEEVRIDGDATVRLPQNAAGTPPVVPYAVEDVEVRCQYHGTTRTGRVTYAAAMPVTTLLAAQWITA